MYKRISIVVVRKDNKLLMGKRHDTGKWTVPGGNAKEQEKPIEAAKREFKEETGITPQNLRLASVTHKKNKNKLIYVFTAEVKSSDFSVEDDPDNEVSKWKFIDPLTIIDELHIPLKEDEALKVFYR